MQVVPPVAVELVATGEVGPLVEGAVTGAAPEPGEVGSGSQALWLLAAVFLPVDVGLPAQNAGARAPTGAERGVQEGPDVEPHTVIEVRLPAEGLLVKRLPANERVVGRLAREDLLQLSLQVLRRGQPAVGAFLPLALLCLLPVDPVAEVAVGQRLKRAATLAVRAGELVAVDQRGEPVLVAVPEVPDEGTVVKELAVFLEEPVAQPGFEGIRGLLAVTGDGQQVTLPGSGPFGTECGGQQPAEAVSAGGLAARGTQADDAVLVAILGERLAAGGPVTGFIGETHS